jgi:hypothetical protein
MKVTIEVDCTPEEARRMMGLPDLTPLHDHFLTRMRDTIDGQGPSPELVAAMFRSWAPVGDAGMDFWRQLFAPGKSSTTKPGT